LCDGEGFCIRSEFNPCAVNGCEGKKCGTKIQLNKDEAGARRSLLQHANIFDIVDPTQEHQQEKNPDSLSPSTPMKSVSKDVEEVPAIQIKKKSTTKRPPEADWKIHYNDVKQRMTKMEDKVDKLAKNQAILISMLRSES